MIAIDWGSSSLRAFRLDGQGRILESRRSQQGVLATDGGFEQVLCQQIQGWDDRLILMCGMVGSRQGWQEVPYVACTAGVEEIAAGMVQLEDLADLPGRELWIIPGVSLHRAAGTYDVMRGEETQVCGLIEQLPAGSHLACLAGTHSKHLHLQAGRITGFTTLMTGELFDTLSRHSILARLMQPGEHHEVVFAKGVDLAASGGNLMGDVFSVRTQALLGDLNPAWLRSYLSGILIGHELNAIPVGTSRVHLVAPPSLMLPYRSALWRRGFETETYAETCAARGMHVLASRRGLSMQA